MAYASLVLLKTVCLMCVVTYIAVAAMFIISGTRTPYPMITIPRRLLQDAKAALANPAAGRTLPAPVASQDDPLKRKLRSGTYDAFLTPLPGAEMSGLSRLLPSTVTGPRPLLP